MDRFEWKMTEKEDQKCKRVLELFQNFLNKQEGTCILKTERYGYVVLYDIAHSSFGYNAICRDAEDLFEEIMQVWNLEYLYKAGMQNDCDDFDTSEKMLSPEQREYWKKAQRYYNKKLDEILDEFDRK